MSDRFAEDLARGTDLFNRGRFFEAHDAWEDGWRVERGARRLLLQGLIQVAAAFVKLERGAPGSALELLDKGMEKLTNTGPDDGGIDLPALLGSLERWRSVTAQMAETGAREYDGAALPRLTRRAGGDP